MAVGSSFDLWQKDVFFSAAEEVQGSTDIMESAYRLWLRERSEGHNYDVVEELRRELQTALGTAKWQLQEFERAVKQSHQNILSDKDRISRHSEFIEAIEEQISHVEKTLGYSLVGEEKKPFFWVQLDEEERDDLELFLSPTLQYSQQTVVGCKGDYVGPVKGRGSPSFAKSFEETVTFDHDAKYIVKLENTELNRTRDMECSQEEHNNGKRANSPDIGAWKIVIANEEEERELLETKTDSPICASKFFNILKIAELTTKAKWLRRSPGKAKSEDPHSVRQSISSYLDLKGVTRVSQKLHALSERGRSCLHDCKESDISHFVEAHQQRPSHCMQFRQPLQFTLLILISMLLIVPFVLRSTWQAGSD